MAEVARVIARLSSVKPGPLLLVVGGVHGNEPAGVRAAARVVSEIEDLTGDVVALAGNVRALNAGRRYLSRDLNRQWSPGRIRALDEGLTPEDPEGMEQRELRAEMDAVIAAARGPVYFLDLHTTSAAGVPFGLSIDSAKQREFAAHFPLPVILGLEEQVEGVLSQYLRARGATTLSVEGGQHADPSSDGNLAAVIRIALAAAGIARLPRLDESFTHLREARGDLPPLIEILFRHAIEPDHGFRMEPGFANIHRARAGQLLAHDRSGEIRAPEDGVVLLPLYQAQGDEGFFFGRARG
jgi:predicted deacylase